MEKVGGDNRGQVDVTEVTTDGIDHGQAQVQILTRIEANFRSMTSLTKRTEEVSNGSNGHHEVLVMKFLEENFTETDPDETETN